ncbi:MAG TPA: hypothetical protein VJ804_14435, partial [Acidimicrobiales bacterium]|nr:hypothetical protein [Acidimicrobiales bacterium]
VHPDGWPERIRLGRPADVLVPAGHPWSDQPGTTVVGSAAELLDRTVAALVVATEPIVEACRALAPVGRAGLWNEVGDALGTALADEEQVVVTRAMVAILDHAVRAPSARWRARPSLRFADSALGPLHVVQKGGCCLAYTREHWPDVPEELLGEAERQYHARFPTSPDERHYCSTCSLRSPEDCDARQVCWRELVHAERATAP